MGPAETTEIKVNEANAEKLLEQVDDPAVVPEGIKLPSKISNRQKKQLIRLMTGKKPIRANQTKAKMLTPKKKKRKLKSTKSARKKNRK